MKIKEIFTDSITFPFSNLKRFLTLGFILIFSPIIIPTILAQGYAIRIIRNTSQGRREMPEFKDWVDMFIDGLKYLIVNIVYTIPGGILVYIAIMISTFTTISESMLSSGQLNQTATMYSGSYLSMDYTSLIHGTLPMVLVSLGIILFALSYLIQMIAIPRMVYKNKVGAAFEFKEIYKEIRLLGWNKYLICGVFLAVISVLSMLSSMFLPSTLTKYGALGYLIIWIIIPFVFDSFFYNFTGRFMGLVYPGEVENEDETEISPKTPRFVQDN
jgi:hypothetical protein